MRLMFKRPLTDVWLDLDVDAASISYTEALNGPGDITAEIPISYNLKRGEDSAYVVSEYETLMIVENGYDGLIVALVDNIELGTDTMMVSGAGLSVLSKGTPWTADPKKYYETSAVEVFRDIWAHILSFENGNPGLKITGATTSPGVMGVSPSLAYQKAETDYLAAQKLVAGSDAALKRREAELKQRVADLFKAAGLYTVGEVKWQASAPSVKTNVVWIESDNANQAKVYKNGTWIVKTGINAQIQNYTWAKSYRDNAAKNAKDAKAELTAAKEALDDLSEKKGESYDLNWWQTLDLSQKISELVDAGPFEFVERAKWEGDDLDLAIEVGSPRIGTRRENLVFELGVNVTAIPQFKQIDPYTDVFVLGAGEGSATLASGMSVLGSQRVRRVDVKTDKDATTRTQVDRVAAHELRRHQRRIDFAFDTVIVSDHAWARSSQYNVGDEIRVTGQTPSNMYFDRWVRILEKTVSSETEDIVLKVEVI